MLSIKTEFDVEDNWSQSPLGKDKCTVCDSTLSLVRGVNIELQEVQDGDGVKVENSEVKATSFQLDDMDDCLEKQLKLTFLLRNMLNTPASQVSKLLLQCGGANLTELISLCVECEGILNTAWRMHWEGQTLAKQLKNKFTHSSKKTLKDPQKKFDDDGSTNSFVRKCLTDTVELVEQRKCDNDGEPNYIIPDDMPPPEKKMRGKGFKRRVDTSISHKGFYTLVNNHKKWACTCGSSFQKKSHFNRHMQSQNPTTRRSYPCSFCGESLSRPIDLKRHVAHQHSNLKTQCDKCGAIIAGKEAWYMRKHQKSKYCQLVALKLSYQKSQPRT